MWTHITDSLQICRIGKKRLILLEFQEIWISLGAGCGFVVKYSEECFGRPRVWGACNVVMVGLLAIPEILEFFCEHSYILYASLFQKHKI